MYTYTYIYIHIPAYTYVLNYDADKIDGLMGVKVYVKFLDKFSQISPKFLQLRYKGEPMEGLTREAKQQKRTKYVAIYLVRITCQS
jgi:hypothetical protein